MPLFWIVVKPVVCVFKSGCFSGRVRALFVRAFFQSLWLVLSRLHRCGMPKEATERAAQQHEDWMVNGRYGCIQLFDPATD